MKAHKLGREGEVFARDFLQKKGYRILVTNYRVKTGEIDIVADHRGTVVFIEVKTRQAGGWADALEAVHPSKQRTMARTATYYLVQTFGREDIKSRFDVLAIHADEGGVFSGYLVENAFFVS